MPDRRAFLEAAALVATTPADAIHSLNQQPRGSDGECWLTQSDDTAAADDDPAVVECAICGAEKPAGMVSRTTVDPIAPLEADICAVCEFVQNHALPDDVCMQCGDPADPGFRIELEYPLGEAGLPALKTGALCGDCAGWIASDIAYRGLDADPEAKTAWRELIDAEREQRPAEEGSA